MLHNPPKLWLMNTPRLFLAAITAPLFPFVLSANPQLPTSPEQAPEGMAKSDWHVIRAAYDPGHRSFQKPSLDNKPTAKPD